MSSWLNYKQCATCTRVMSADDMHRRCQVCREPERESLAWWMRRYERQLYQREYGRKRRDKR